MGVTIALLSFFALLFGMVFLALVCGIKSREEEERALDQVPASASGQPAPARPSFFEPVQTTATSAAVDPELLRSLEQYLLSEREAADGFVLEPSLAHLYRPDEPARQDSVESLTGQLERFLGSELAAVARFVREPSPASLHVLAAPLALAS